VSPGPSFVAGFQRGLKEAGYIEGHNVAIEYRWAENQNDRLPALAAELARRQVTVIATLATGAMAAKAATTTIPIVFLIGEDPVRLDLVASLARPAGNLTGVNLFSGELTSKRLELLREILPAATRVSVVVNPTGPNAETTMSDVQPAARAMGLQIQIHNAGTSREISAAFATFVRERPDALFVDLDPFLTSRRVQLVTLATRHAIPASYAVREFAEIGGLMSYGSPTVRPMHDLARAGLTEHPQRPARQDLNTAATERRTGWSSRQIISDGRCHRGSRGRAPVDRSPSALR
jgi:putative tryptophan/tyrosine transport system substrate-binding protein